MQLDSHMRDRACPLCGSRDASRIFADANFHSEKLDGFAFASRKVPEYMHLRLVSCPGCDLLYASPIPSEDFLHRAYHEAAFDSQEEARCAATTYAGFLSAIRPKLTSLDGALDIGTGEGAFLSQLLIAGFTHVRGVEPSAAPIAIADHEVRSLIIHDIFRPQIFTASSLSLVTCFQTLEHLSDPLEMARAAFRVLRPGGAVFFVSHNRRAISAKLLGLKSPIFDIEHLQLFSPRSARELLRITGFERVEVRPIYNRYPLEYWFKLLPIPLRIKQSILGALRKTGVGKIPICLPAGNIAMIGFKPDDRC